MVNKKIAIIHDALVVAGGAERFALALSQAIPDASFYTSVYLPEHTFHGFISKKIHTLKGSTLVHNEKQFKRLFPLWFLGFRFLNLSNYDIIFSSSTYAAKYVRVKKNSIHISYIHSPFRFLWKRNSYSADSIPFRGLTLRIIDLFIPILQKIDRYYSNRITQIITNSQNMAKFIKKIYNRDAIVIYPPVDIDQYHLSDEKKDYYLFVGRLVSYKRADLAIHACQQGNRKLVIIGVGPELNSLKKIAGPETLFLGRVNDEILKNYYAEAKALIFPGIEDFGLIPIEAQASGCPIIATRAGGAVETIVDGKTGVFFETQTVNDLIKALERFEKLAFQPNQIREHSRQFDVSIFNKSITSLMQQYKK